MERRCPRCKEYIPEELFEDPVSICLVCYARIPANAGLSLDDLRMKAHRSFPAQRRKRKEDARDMLEQMSGQARSHPTGAFQAIDEKLQHASDAGLEFIDCDLCQGRVKEYYIRQNHGIIEVVCPSCKEREVTRSHAGS